MVGGSVTSEGEGHAFITGGPTGMTDLGTLGGRFRSYSTAYGINAAGRVVGVSDTAEEGEPHAFITGPDGTGMTDLGTLGGRSSIASDINDSGEVIGMSETADGATHVFITGPGGEGMMDLTSLVRLPGGLVLTDAAAINNLGQVLAVGVIPEPQSLP